MIFCLLPYQLLVPTELTMNYLPLIYSLAQFSWAPRKFEKNALEMDPFNVECQVYMTGSGQLGVVSPYRRGWLTTSKAQDQDIPENLWYDFEWRRKSVTAVDPIRGFAV